MGRRLPGFEQVEYRDWRSLFARLAADAKRVLVGEAKAWRKPATVTAVRAEVQRLTARPLPELGGAPKRVERVLFVPALAPGVASRHDGVRVVTLDALLT